MTSRGKGVWKCDPGRPSLPPVDGSLKSGINSPVEGQVVEIPVFIGFQHHPKGGCLRFQPSTVPLNQGAYELQRVHDEDPWNPWLQWPKSWKRFIYICMDVSKNRGGPHKKSILIGSSIIFTIHFGVPLFFGNTQIIYIYITLYNHYLDVPLEVGINGDRISGLFHLLING